MTTYLIKYADGYEMTVTAETIEKTPNGDTVMLSENRTALVTIPAGTEVIITADGNEVTL